MAAQLHSTRPYVIRDGKAWCAACGRRRLCRIDGTRYVACPDCDRGETVEAGQATVTLSGGELLCASCGRNALVPAPTTGTLECPACDTPPWERDRVAQPAAVQLSLLTVGECKPAPVQLVAPDGTKTPDSVVRACFFCGQTTWHHARWSLSRWRHVCEACGGRLSISRAKGARVTKRGDQ